MGAACFHTNSEIEREILKAEWDEMRFGWGCMSPADIGAQKAAIEKLCKATKLCDREFKEQVRVFFEKSERMKRRLGK